MEPIHSSFDDGMNSSESNTIFRIGVHNHDVTEEERNTQTDTSGRGRQHTEVQDSEAAYYRHCRMKEDCDGTYRRRRDIMDMEEHGITHHLRDCISMERDGETRHVEVEGDDGNPLSF